jgi:hypothetical protein
MPLIDYYEQVVFEGLRFARNDALRGVLPAEQVERINQALLDIIEDLESVDDSRHAALEGDSARDGGKVVEFTLSPDAGEVLCIPGRGAFDDVAVAIVGQLLMRRSIPCTATTYDEVRATRGAMIDERSPAICVVSLDAPESAPYLRNLVRRLRERAPEATIVVGIGAAQRDDGAGIADDPGTLFPISLGDLVEACGAALAPVRQPPPEKREVTQDAQDRYSAGAKL